MEFQEEENEKKIEIGKSICFILKDDDGNFNSITTKILEEDDIEKVGGIFNSKYYVAAFVEDNMLDAMQAAQDYQNSITGLPMSPEEINNKWKKRKSSGNNFPGGNSYIKLPNGDIIRLIPE